VKTPVSKGRNVKKQVGESVSAKTLLSMFVGGVVGLLVGLATIYCICPIQICT
jgi:hypothetical protein